MPRPSKKDPERSPPEGQRGGRLGLRLVLIAALVAILTAAGGAAALLLLAAPKPDRSASAALSRGATALTNFQQERLLRVRLVAQRLAGEPSLPPLLAAAGRRSGATEAGEEPATDDPLGDWLRQRRGALGFDLALVVDPAGRVLARSDRPRQLGETLGGDPLLTSTLGPEGRAGAWVVDGKLDLAAADQVTNDFEPLGFVIAAFAVDDVVALEIEKLSGAEVAFVAATPDGHRLAAASFDAAAAGALVPRLGDALAGALSGGGKLAQAQVDVGGRRLETQVMPLQDAAGQAVGAAILSAPAAAPATLTPVLAGLAAAAGLALLIALPFSLLAGRRAAGPVGRLAAVVEAARQGDYGGRLDPGRSGPLAPLAAGLEGLFIDLEETRALAAVTDGALARGREAAAAPADEVAAALLAIDLRAYARGQAEVDARDSSERLGRDLSWFEAAVVGRGGKVEAALGHRVLASFVGGDRAFRAVAAGGEALARLSRREAGSADYEPPALAVASGKVVCGSASLRGATERTVVGPPVQLLDSLLREAAPGELVVAPPVHRELSTRLAELGAAAQSRRGLISPQPVFALDAAAAARVAGIEPPSSESEIPDPWGDPAQRALAGPGELGVGSHFGDRFDIVALVGTSSSGSLFRARDVEPGETVALKVFTPAVVLDPTLFDRLDTALQGVRKLVHPHLARTYDFGRTSGLCYIARELVSGVVLTELLGTDQRLPAAAALRLLRQLASALAVVHDGGLAHGRLTPTNLVLEAGGRLKVTDLGVGLAVRPPLSGLGDGPLAPELLAGRPPSARSDVFAAGALLHRALTGGWPADEPASAGLPPGVAAVVAGCLRRDPAARFAGGDELLHALDDVHA